MAGIIKPTTATIARVNDSAADLALHTAGLDIKDLDADDIEAVQDAIHDALYEGWTDARLRRRIQRVVGLGKRGQTAVAAHQAGLVARGMDPTQAAKSADAYADRLRKARAKTIAAHEVRKVLAQAQRDDWVRQQAEGTLSNRAVRVYRVHKDERTCKVCRPLNGRRIGIASPVPAPPLHPNCRCWEEVKDEGIFKGSSQVTDAVVKSVMQKDKVRTPAGVRRYGLPIGSPIVPRPNKPKGVDFQGWPDDGRDRGDDYSDQRVWEILHGAGFEAGDTLQAVETLPSGDEITWNLPNIGRANAIDGPWSAGQGIEEMRRALGSDNKFTLRRLDQYTSMPDTPDATYSPGMQGVYRTDALLMNRGLLPVLGINRLVGLGDYQGEIDTPLGIRVELPPDTTEFDNKLNIQSAIRLMGFDGGGPVDDDLILVAREHTGSVTTGRFLAASEWSPEGRHNLAKFLEDYAKENADDMDNPNVTLTIFSRNHDSGRFNEVISEHRTGSDDGGYEDEDWESEGREPARYATLMGFDFESDEYGNPSMGPGQLEELTDAFNFELPDVTYDDEHGRMETRNLQPNIQEPYDDQWSVQIEGDVYFVSDDGSETYLGNFTRTLNFSEGEVYNDYFVVAPEFRNNGFAAKFNAQMFSYYSELGFDSVGLHANIDVGGYAWARQGFDWERLPFPIRRLLEQLEGVDETEEQEANKSETMKRLQAEVRILLGNVDNDGYVSAYEVSELGHDLWDTLTDDEKRDVWEEMYGDRPAHFGYQAGWKHWPGKNVLLGSGWEGRLSLNDFNDAVNRFGTNEWKKGIRGLKMKKSGLTGADIFVLHQQWEKEHDTPSLFQKPDTWTEGDVYAMHVVDVEATKAMEDEWRRTLAAAASYKAGVSKGRKVRTPAGARRYGLPIGSPIVSHPHVPSKRDLLAAVRRRPSGEMEDVPIDLFRRNLRGTRHEEDGIINEPDFMGNLAVTDTAAGITKAMVGIDLRRKIRARPDFEEQMNKMKFNDLVDEVVPGILKEHYDLNTGPGEDHFRWDAKKAWAWAVGYDTDRQTDQWMVELRQVLTQKADTWDQYVARLDELDVYSYGGRDALVSAIAAARALEDADLDDPAIRDEVRRVSLQMSSVGSAIQTEINYKTVRDVDAPKHPELLSATENFILSNAFKTSDIPLGRAMASGETPTFEAPPLDFDTADLNDIGREVALAVGVRQIIDSWAISSNSENVASLGFQLAVSDWTHKRFGQDAGDHQYLATKDHYEEGRTWYEDRQPLYEMYLDATYENTQEMLASEGLDFVPLFRGMIFPRDQRPDWIQPQKRLTDILEEERQRLRAEYPNAGETAIEHQARANSADLMRAQAIEGSADVDIRLNPASSWSIRPEVAENFSAWSMGSYGDYSVMMRAVVPREAVLTTTLTGQGALRETEFVLMGYGMPVTASWKAPNRG